jgi:hypothetical protein
MTGFKSASAKTASSPFALHWHLVEVVGPPSGYSRNGLLRDLSDAELNLACRVIDEWVAANILRAIAGDSPGPRMEALLAAADRLALRNSWGNPEWSPALCERLEYWRRMCRRMPA